jgi:hypothetical protein
LITFPSTPPAPAPGGRRAQRGAGRCLAEEEDGFQVRVHHEIPLRFLEIDGERRRADACVVHEHVEPPEPLHRPIDDGAGLLNVRHVRGERDPVRPSRPDLIHEAIEIGRAPRHAGHPRARLREPQRDRPADPPARAGDDRDAPGEIESLRPPSHSFLRKSARPEGARDRRITAGAEALLAAVGGECQDGASGSSTRKVVPRPVFERTVMRPPMRCRSW